METDNNEQEKPWFNLAASSQVRMAGKPINIRWIRAGSLSHIKKSCIASYYRQFFQKYQNKNHKITTSFVSPGLRPLGANKT